jgi:hypothetical protein
MALSDVSCASSAKTKNAGHRPALSAFLLDPSSAAPAISFRSAAPRPIAFEWPISLPLDTLGRPTPLESGPVGTLWLWQPMGGRGLLQFPFKQGEDAFALLWRELLQPLQDPSHTLALLRVGREAITCEGATPPPHLAHVAPLVSFLIAPCHPRFGPALLHRSLARCQLAIHEVPLPLVQDGMDAGLRFRRAGSALAQLLDPLPLLFGDRPAAGPWRIACVPIRGWTKATLGHVAHLLLVGAHGLLELAIDLPDPALLLGIQPKGLRGLLAAEQRHNIHVLLMHRRPNQHSRPFARTRASGRTLPREALLHVLRSGVFHVRTRHRTLCPTLPLTGRLTLGPDRRSDQGHSQGRHSE